MNELENPMITNARLTGWPNGKEPERPICPACGEECQTIYRDRFGVIVGCDGCVERNDAWEAPECFPGREDA